MAAAAAAATPAAPGDNQSATAPSQSRARGRWPRSRDAAAKAKPAPQAAAAAAAAAAATVQCLRRPTCSALQLQRCQGLLRCDSRCAELHGGAPVSPAARKTSVCRTGEQVKYHEGNALCDVEMALLYRRRGRHGCTTECAGAGGVQQRQQRRRRQPPTPTSYLFRASVKS